MKITLIKDKVTKNTIRFRETGNEERPLVVYLTKDRVAELGNPESISVTIEKES